MNAIETETETEIDASICLSHATLAVRRFLLARPATAAQYDMYSTTVERIATEAVHYGIVGFMDLIFAKYVFVVTGRTLAAGTIQSFVKVWRITKVEAVPVWRQAVTSLEEDEHERICLSSITSELMTGNIYFSLDVDLTNNAQSRYNAGQRNLSTLCDLGYFAHLNDRFFWNKHLLKPLLHSTTEQFILPVICGHVGSTPVTVDGPPVALLFVSRFNRHQAGTRYWRRGIDRQGHAAMEAETDVLVVRHFEKIASFCMIRGSVPLLWSQTDIDDPFKRPAMNLSIAASSESTEAMKRHFQYLLEFYGGHVDAIDMLDRTEAVDADSAKLSHLYEGALRDWNHPSIRYMKRSPVTTKQAVEDFKREIPDLVKQQGFLHADLDPKTGLIKTLKSHQTGIIRVNSLDCVDEASIVQFLIARHTLEMLLKDMGVWRADRTSLDPGTEYRIRQLWIENADALSYCYTGTPMRFAHRIRQSFIDNLLGGLHSTVIILSRTYMSYFQDYARQDSIEFFMGLQDDHAAAMYSMTLDSPNRAETVYTASPTASASASFSSIDSIDGDIRFSAVGETLIRTEPTFADASTSPLSPMYGYEHDIPAHVATSMRTAAMSHVSNLINLRRRLSYHELTQPPLLSTILLLRKMTAPKYIRTNFDLCLAMIWLVIYIISLKILKHPASLLIRRPRKEMDLSRVPDLPKVEPHGVSVYINQQRVERLALTMKMLSSSSVAGRHTHLRTTHHHKRK
eukprot:jgi/Hompol1/936/HPOL_001072-RA